MTGRRRRSNVAPVAGQARSSSESTLSLQGNVSSVVLLQHRALLSSGPATPV